MIYTIPEEPPVAALLRFDVRSVEFNAMFRPISEAHLPQDSRPYRQTTITTPFCVQDTPYLANRGVIPVKLDVFPFGALSTQLSSAVSSFANKSGCSEWDGPGERIRRGTVDGACSCSSER